MSLENHLKELFVATARITAIVGAAGAARIEFVTLPQGAVYPAIVITRVSGVGGYHLRGSDGKDHSRIQFDLYAQSYTALKDKATGLLPAVVDTLKNYTGTRKNCRVFSCLKGNQQDFFDDATRAYRTVLDYKFIDMEV